MLCCFQSWADSLCLLRGGKRSVSKHKQRPSHSTVQTHLRSWTLFLEHGGFEVKCFQADKTAPAHLLLSLSVSLTWPTQHLAPGGELLCHIIQACEGFPICLVSCWKASEIFAARLSEKKKKPFWPPHISNCTVYHLFFFPGWVRLFGTVGCQSDKMRCKGGRCVNVEKQKLMVFFFFSFSGSTPSFFSGCSCDTHACLLVYIRKTSPGGEPRKPAATRSACMREVEGWGKET